MWLCRPVDLYNTNPHFGTMKDLQHLLGTAYGQGDSPTAACVSQLPAAAMSDGWLCAERVAAVFIRPVCHAMVHVVDQDAFACPKCFLQAGVWVMADVVLAHV